MTVDPAPPVLRPYNEDVEGMCTPTRPPTGPGNDPCTTSAFQPLYTLAQVAEIAQKTPSASGVALTTEPYRLSKSPETMHGWKFSHARLADTLSTPSVTRASALSDLEHSIYDQSVTRDFSQRGVTAVVVPPGTTPVLSEYVRDVQPSHGMLYDVSGAAGAQQSVDPFQTSSTAVRRDRSRSRTPHDVRRTPLQLARHPSPTHSDACSVCATPPVPPPSPVPPLPLQGYLSSDDSCSIGS